MKSDLCLATVGSFSQVPTMSVHNPRWLSTLEAAAPFQARRGSANVIAIDTFDLSNPSPCAANL